MSDNVSKWFQLASVVSLLVGLLAVVYQLYQNERLARFELHLQQSTSESEKYKAQLGEDFYLTFAKTFENPSDLTDAELVQVLAFYDIFYHEVRARKLLQEEGIFKGDWRLYVSSDSADLCAYFNTSVGRQWTALEWDEIKTEMATQLDKCSDRNLKVFMDYLRVEMKKEDGT